MYHSNHCKQKLFYEYLLYTMFEWISNIEPELTHPFIILSLLMSANYLGEIFPCRVQAVFSKNMIVKHILGFLSLMFFVVLTRPSLYTSTNFVYVSVLLYVFFMFLSKLNYIIWFLVFGIFAIIYVSHVYLTQIESENQINRSKIGDNTVSPDTDDKMPTQNITEKIDTIKTMQKYLLTAVLPITLVGFIHYLGEKKIEFGHNGFDYNKFLFGKPKCNDASPNYKGFFDTMKHAFK